MLGTALMLGCNPKDQAENLDQKDQKKEKGRGEKREKEYIKIILKTYHQNSKP